VALLLSRPAVHRCVRSHAELRTHPTPPPCPRPHQLRLQHDLYDALFYVRILLAALLGVGFGFVGAQGLMVFLL